MYVYNASMQLILNPRQFDIILTKNMFGDILSDEASVIGGAIGLLPSASIGDRIGMFEPIHGSYPQAKGKGNANPIAAILSTVMLLEYLELHQEADCVRKAVHEAITNHILTPELNSLTPHTTEQLGSYVAHTVQSEETNIFLWSNIRIDSSTII